MAFPLGVQASLCILLTLGATLGAVSLVRRLRRRDRWRPDLATSGENLRAILDSLQDSYFEADPNGIVTFANRAFWENLGLPGRDAVIGRNFRRFTDPRSIRTLYREFGELYRTAAPVPRFEYFFRAHDGASRPGEASISPVVRGGRVVGSRGLIRDVTERIRTEQMLRESMVAAQTRAAELDAVNRVAATVAQTLDLDQVLQAVCEELAAIFPVRNAGVALITEDGQNLEVVAFHSPLPEEKSAIGMILPFAGNPSSQEVIRSRKPLVIQDAQTDPRTEPMSGISRARGTRAIMIVPMLSRGEAIGTIGIPALDPYYVFTQAEVRLAETIASQIASAVDNARVHARMESALTVAEHDLEIGREIQSGFFPESMPQIPGWEIAARFTAARQVAGDFYDAFPIRNTDYVAVVIADVCDKGVGAALFMVLIRSLVRAFSENSDGRFAPRESLTSVVQRTNDFIAEYHGRSNMFATLFIGVLDADSGTLHYVNGGHEPPVILNAAGTITRRLHPTGPAVGMFAETPFEAAEIHLAPGDCLVGFTDGTTDARNRAGLGFTEERLLSCLASPWTSVFSMLFELDTELRGHIDEEPQFDDITLIALRRRNSETEAVHAICRVATEAALPELREFVEAAAVHCGLAHDDVFAFKSSADEVCTNIVQHGYEDRPPGLVSIAFELADERAARLVITDDGRHFPPGRAAPPDLTSDWEIRVPGGLGIHLVQAQMDTVTYGTTDEGANRLVLEKCLEPKNNER